MLYKQLLAWLLQGSLYDPFHEFFIVKDNKADDSILIIGDEGERTRSKSRSYELKLELVPGNTFEIMNLQLYIATWQGRWGVKGIVLRSYFWTWANNTLNESEHPRYLSHLPTTKLYFCWKSKEQFTELNKGVAKSLIFHHIMWCTYTILNFWLSADVKMVKAALIILKGHSGLISKKY